MTIQELSLKCKKALEGDLFVVLVIILVGIASFGLGRLSTLPGREPVKIYQNPASGTAFLSTASAGRELGQGRGIGQNQGTSPSAPRSEGKYVASKNGSVYHLPSCSGAKRIKEENKIWFDTTEAAELAGYRKAANCEGL